MVSSLKHIKNEQMICSVGPAKHIRSFPWKHLESFTSNAVFGNLWFTLFVPWKDVAGGIIL